MRAVTCGLLAALAALPAAAQQRDTDPVEAHLMRQWQARQVMDGNVAAAIERLLDARRGDRAEAEKLKREIAALRERCGAACGKAEP